jgi:hypothetical protein
LWIEFRSILKEKLAVLPDWLVAGQYGIASKPRPLIPQYEYFLMHATADGWRVAGLESALPVPGWPPRFEQLVA